MELMIWAIVIAIALIIEFFTFQLVTVWIAVGGLVALILSAVGINMEIQIISVLIISLGCILGLRNFALKILNKNSEDRKAEPLIGKKAKLIEECTNKKNGTIKLNGVIWSVYSDEEISANEEIEVISVNGNKLKVKQIKGE